MPTVSCLKHRTVRSSIVLAFVTLLLPPVASNVVVRAQDKATVNPTSISVSAAVSNREQDGLSGPVRRVRTQIAKITTEAGKPVETPRLLLGVTSYDLQGNRTDNVNYLAPPNTLSGREVYQYDQRGNMVEMTVRDQNDAVLSKETYTYEFDAAGNWTKMITSVAMLEGGQVTFEPTEVTYRAIAYYLTDAIAKKMQPTAAAPTTLPAAVVSPPAAAVLTSAGGEKQLIGQPTTTAAAAASLSPSGVAPTTKENEAVMPHHETANALGAKMTRAGATGDQAGEKATVGDKAAVTAPSLKADEKPTSEPTPKSPARVVSGAVVNAKALSLPKPFYPDAAKSAKLTGLIRVEIIINETGKVISAHAADGFPALRDAAEAAARQASFSPALLSGRPVQVPGVITYNFQIAP